MTYDTFDTPRRNMRQGSMRQRGMAPTAASVAATMSQTPAAPPPPPAPHEFIAQAYDAKGGKMTAQEWQHTATGAVQTHGYDSKDLKGIHSEMLKAGQIKRSRVRFTGYQWNHNYGQEMR